VILVDSSVWIDHLRNSDTDLFAWLEAGLVVCHPFVIGEVACGYLRNRARLLDDLTLLPQSPVATHSEAMLFLERHGLFGVGWTDVHLLASAAFAADTRVWSKDKRLMAAAERIDLHYAEPNH
jgi:predicted nucleic acid-binding protein